MSPQLTSTRQRLLNAALELFVTQGVAETTTRQIAELAQVNEVTLFRHFGNKHGLLFAVIKDSPVFRELGESLKAQANQTSSVYQALKNYAHDRLQALEQMPELIRSVIGESGHYPEESRQAIGQSITQANHYVAEYITAVMERDQLETYLPAEKLAGLLNSLLLGYAVIEFTSDRGLWHDQDEFLEDVVELFLHQSKATDAFNFSTQQKQTVADLPATIVHSILQRAKKLGLRDYALMYVLFAAGVSPAEIFHLERSHQISDANQHLLQISQGFIRQVPVNQWIMGKRYGSYTRNPLTQWLKSRKDEQKALFLNDQGMPISEAEIQLIWQTLTEELLTPEGQQPAIEKAQQTWCVEMLMKGMSLEDLSILIGGDVTTLQPLAQRAREKLALEQAIRLDHKS